MVFTDAVNGWCACALVESPISHSPDTRLHYSLTRAYYICVLVTTFDSFSWLFFSLVGFWHLGHPASHVTVASAGPRSHQQVCVQGLGRELTWPSYQLVICLHTYARPSPALCRRRRPRCGTRCCCSWLCKRRSSNVPSDPSSKPPLPTVHRPEHRGSLC